MTFATRNPSFQGLLRRVWGPAAAFHRLMCVAAAISTCAGGCASGNRSGGGAGGAAGLRGTAEAAGAAGSSGTSGVFGAVAGGTSGGASAGGGDSNAGGTSSAAAGGGAGLVETSGSGGSTAGAANGGASGTGGAGTSAGQRRLLLRDEARSVVSYVDLGNSTAGWHVTTGTGRDLQLVGGDRFMVGTDNGYEERLLSNGALVTQQKAFPGTLSAHRLRNRNTILAGVNWQGANGISLIEVDAAGEIKSKVSYPSFSYVRLIRQTPTGTFLVAADTVVFEGDATGKILWRVDAAPAGSHVWQALRLPSGETVVSTGYGASLALFGADGTLHKTITGPASVGPYQFVGFQILPSGDYVVANWQGHSGEKAGVQLLEYNPQGTLVWSYRPNTTTESLSLHAVIVLDGLDTSKLNVDDTSGVLVAVQ
jgi:hypothetical protein